MTAPQHEWIDAEPRFQQFGSYRLNLWRIVGYQARGTSDRPYVTVWYKMPDNSVEKLDITHKNVTIDWVDKVLMKAGEAKS